jgi:hypothetical protein
MVSLTRKDVVLSRPSPPYFSGMSRPRRPSSAAFLREVHGERQLLAVHVDLLLVLDLLDARHDLVEPEVARRVGEELLVLGELLAREDPAARDRRYEEPAAGAGLGNALESGGRLLDGGHGLLPPSDGCRYSNRGAPHVARFA